jgi:hypothetical protein
MGPVRVKYYGLFWMSRPTYMVLQTIVLLLCVVFILVGLLNVLLTGSLLPHRPPILADVLLMLFWVGVVAFPLESIEMYVMLRKFARAKNEQQAQLAAFDTGEPAASVPSTTAVQSSPNERPNTDLQS